MQFIERHTHCEYSYRKGLFRSRQLLHDRVRSNDSVKTSVR